MKEEKPENRVVIITGGASGIGEATARRFAKNGDRVIIFDSNLEGAQSVSSEINNANGQSESHQVDVSNPEAIKTAIATIKAKHEHIHVMVNNAGVANKKMELTAEHSLEEWDRVISINQSGVFYCMKYGLQHMTAQGFGNIVNVASLAGIKASGRNLAYSASKFAVVGMTKSAALEYASRNIRINCVCPGYTRSALLETVFKENASIEEKLLKYIPMKRYGEAPEIAESIFWLASDNTSFITGQSIILDGGLSL